MRKSIVPTSENIKKQADRWEKNKKRIDKLVEEKIDPIYEELAVKIGGEWLKKAKYAPWILSRMMTVEQAKISLALPDPYRDSSWGREHLGVTEQFAKEVGLDKETADKHLQGLSKKGFVNATRKGYQIPRGSHFFTHGNPYKDDKDLQDACWIFGRYLERDERSKVIDSAKEAGRPLAGFAMIPRWKAIKDIPGVLPIEDMREILKAHKRFAVVSCICKADDRERDCGTPSEVCMTFDRGADNRIDVRKDGRELTLKEALDFVDGFSKYPIVSGLMGYDPKATGLQSVLSICNCHWDCCLAMTGWFLPGSKHKVNDWWMKTRFRATVDLEKCIGCGVCVDERCQFGAAQMKYYPEFGAERAYIDEEECMGCGLCVETCTVGARGMNVVKPPEYITDIPEEAGVMQGGLNIEGVLAVAEKLSADGRAAKEKK